MSDHQDRHARAGHLAQPMGQRHAPRRVESGVRFVREQELGPAQQHPRQPDSPCLPAGNPWSATLGAWGEGCSNPAVEATSWGRIKALHR